jgi:hypothetical protein
MDCIGCIWGIIIGCMDCICGIIGEGWPGNIIGCING